jgi:hypothetical protein
MHTDPKSSVDILEHVTGGIHVEQWDRPRDMQPVASAREPGHKEDEPHRERPPGRIDR